MAEPEAVDGRLVLAEALKSTVAASVALGGTLWALSRLFSFYGPVPGPRLRRGELSAKKASEQAERSYWKAETMAARGRCDVAARAFKKGNAYRRQAERRKREGDETGSGFDLKGSWRAAHAEFAHCKR